MMHMCVILTFFSYMALHTASLIILCVCVCMRRCYLCWNHVWMNHVCVCACVLDEPRVCARVCAG